MEAKSIITTMFSYSYSDIEKSAQVQCMYALHLSSEFIPPEISYYIKLLLVENALNSAKSVLFTQLSAAILRGDSIFVRCGNDLFDMITRPIGEIIQSNRDKSDILMWEIRSWTGVFYAHTDWSDHYEIYDMYALLKRITEKYYNCPIESYEDTIHINY